MKAEIGRGPDFAEPAEALGIRTDQVLAVLNQGDGRMVVFWTPEGEEKDPDDNTAVWYSILLRNSDDILLLLTQPRPIPDLMEGIVRRFHELADERKDQ